MPWNEVMKKFGSGTLKSGGSGKPVKNPKQAVAIMLSEKKAAKAGKSEYKAALTPKTAAKVRSKANWTMAIALMFSIFGAQAHAAITSLQVTIGAGTTQVSATTVQCTWVVFQNNATHTMRIGDSTTTSSKGLALIAGGSFYQGPKPTGGATNLANWYVAGTQNDVLDVACDVVNF